MTVANPAFVSTDRLEYTIPGFADDGTSARGYLDFGIVNDTWSFVSQLIVPKSKSVAIPEPTTSGCREIASIPRLAIESNKTVCAAAIDAVGKLPVSSQKRLAMSLLSGIQSHILARSEYREYTKFRPISYTYTSDDNTVVLEWAYKNGRITYFIDEDIEESIAVFIDDMNPTGHPIMKEYDLKTDSLPQLIAESVALVARFAS